MKTLSEIEFSDNRDLAEFLGMDYEETTTGINGYPQSLNWAITSDSIQELLEAKSKLEATGYEVEELILHKRDGWSLWNRGSNRIEKGQMMRANDQDYYFDFNSDEEEEKIKEEIFEEFGYHDLLDDEEERTYDNIRKLVDWINSFYNELPSGEGEIRVFYDPNNGNCVDYWVSEDSSGYSYDTHTYQLAIRVVDFEGELS